MTGAYRRLVRGASRALIVAVALLLPLLAVPGDSLAKSSKHHSRHVHHAVKKPGPKKPTARNRTVKKPVERPASLRAAILIDADTGSVLSATNPDRPAYPASLTKMMTLYLTFAALNEGELALDQRLPVSGHAASQEPSKLWLKAGDSVRVRALILALITRSANDAAVVLAEGVAGTEAAFAQRMTSKARQLGMA